jgi:hypothetical protein
MTAHWQEVPTDSWSIWAVGTTVMENEDHPPTDITDLPDPQVDKPRLSTACEDTVTSEEGTELLRTECSSQSIVSEIQT